MRIRKRKTPDWYPARGAERVPWHANFAAMCASEGAAFGLSPAQIAQAEADAEMLREAVAAMSGAIRYSQALAAYKRLMLDGPRNAAAIEPPAPPAGVSPPDGALPGIAARTRWTARYLRTRPGFSMALQERFGIASPEAAPVGRPSVEAFAEAGGDVRLRIGKAGFFALAVDSRRAGGPWELIGVSLRRVFVDERPGVSGAPEVREYRVQGYAGNERVGETSDVASCVTLP